REPITLDGSWYKLREAALHLRPVQGEIPMAVASMISPSGMKCAGKHGVGVLSVASYSEAGLTAPKTPWGFGGDRGQGKRPAGRSRKLAHRDAVPSLGFARAGVARSRRRPQALEQRIRRRNSRASRWQDLPRWLRGGEVHG